MAGCRGWTRLDEQRGKRIRIGTYFGAAKGYQSGADMEIGNSKTSHVPDSLPRERHRQLVGSPFNLPY